VNYKNFSQKTTTTTLISGIAVMATTRHKVLWDALSTDDFILFYFVLFFRVYFSFSFLFILKNDEEACDNEVT